MNGLENPLPQKLRALLTGIVSKYGNRFIQNYSTAWNIAVTNGETALSREITERVFLESVAELKDDLEQVRIKNNGSESLYTFTHNDRKELVYFLVLMHIKDVCEDFWRTGCNAAQVEEDNKKAIGLIDSNGNKIDPNSDDFNEGSD